MIPDMLARNPDDGNELMASNPPMPAARIPIAVVDTLLQEEARKQRGSSVLVHRDEIIDGRTRICGYRFRTVPMAASVPPSPIVRVNALAADHLAKFALHRTALVMLGVDEWRAADFRQFATPNMVFQVDLPPPDGDIASWRAGLADIKASGAKVALAHDVDAPPFAEALDLADVVCLRPAVHSGEDLARLIGSLRSRHPELAFVADGIETWAEYEACLELGIQYCLGSFATTAHDAGQAPHHIVLDNVLNNRLVQFSWYRVFECGNEAIDRDHQTLFAMANDLLNAIISGKPVGELKNMVVLLAHEAAQHFRREEAILAAAGYAHVAEHARIHRDLADKAAALLREFEAGSVEIGHVFQFLANDIIVKHMLGADREFFPIFQPGGAALPAEGGEPPSARRSS